jgi:RHS repeat-associated protein
VRQKFGGGYERDTETNLDYAQTRYYSMVQGRFTSPDKPFAGQYRRNPQSWNMYSYVMNDPLNFIDPMGLARWKEGKDGKDHFVGDENGEYNKDLNAHWNEKKQRWDFVQGKPKQTTHVEVIIWNQSATPQGLFGHVSYNINSTSWSWQKGGWSKEPAANYLKHNTYRSGVGYVLGDENDPEWAEQFADEIMSFNGDGEGIIQRLFNTGPYALRQDNCGEAFCRAVNKTGGLPRNGGIAPVEHKAYILYKMRPYIRAVNRYNKVTPPARRVDRRGGATTVGRTMW